MKCKIQILISHFVIWFSPLIINCQIETTSPIKLANSITKDLSDEEAKFKSIFNWVATNIKYDYKIYTSSSGTPDILIKDILKRKKGVCLHFAKLMDTLCEAAGIKNTSVFGYAKDELFDIGDSLYADNHAWNAVRLNGLWYLYDVTWASGTVSYNFTKRSLWKIKLLNRLKPKVKQKKIKVNKKFRVRNQCEKDSVLQGYYYKIRMPRPLLRYFLRFIRIKVKEKLIRQLNLDYYLTEPQKFAITHWPDDSKWSLLNTDPIRNFETDSAFYFLTDSSLKFQNRSGTPCLECDQEITLNQYKRWDLIKRNSFTTNNRNLFIQGVANYYQADSKHQESYTEADSANKVNLIDTAIFHYELVKILSKKNQVNVELDFILQKSKNEKKQLLLLSQNKENAQFIRKKYRKSLESKRIASSIFSKNYYNYNKHGGRNVQIRLLKRDVNPVKNKPNAKIQARYTKEFKQLTSKIDSLNKLISELRPRIDSALMLVSLNVWQKAIFHDSIIYPIKKSTSLRTLLSDAYKKDVIDARRPIKYHQINYDRDIDNLVYNPCTFLSLSIKKITTMIDLQFNLSKKVHQQLLLMYRNNYTAPQTINELVQKMEAENQAHQCWYYSIQPAVLATEKGLAKLGAAQNNALSIINHENEVERNRAVIINKKLLNRKKRHKRICTNNADLSRRQISKIRNEKRKFLAELKKNRKKK